MIRKTKTTHKLLRALDDGPLHGYALIFGHRFQSGTVYPLLERLAEEGYLLVLKKDGRRRYYEITESGRELLEKFDEWERRKIEHATT